MRLVYIYLFTLLLTACSKDWLDKKPRQNLTTPTTLDACAALMDNQNMVATGLALGEVASDGHYIPEFFWAFGLENATVNAYTWSNTRPYMNVLEWNIPYECILWSNIVLEALDKIQPLDQAERNRWNNIRGTALFQRARFHFELSQTFSPPFVKGSEATTISIPLRLSADINEKSVKASVKEVYDRIVADLLEAVELLPAKASYKTRASKHATFAQLANVYLNMQEYQKAADCADSSLAIDGSLIDYNTLSASASFIGEFNVEVIYHGVGVSYSGINTSYIYVDRDLYDSYDDNDLRKSRFYTVNTDNTVSFKGNYNSNNYSPFMGLTTSELYLLRAECQARLGNTTDAMKDLNDLLRSRWLKINNATTYTDMTASDATDALNKILTEREKELILRGRRWSDLRRLNLEPTYQATIHRTIGGQSYTLEPDSYKYTFPIPDDERQQSGIDQNPGWNR